MEGSFNTWISIFFAVLALGGISKVLLSVRAAAGTLDFKYRWLLEAPKDYVSRENWKNYQRSAAMPVAISGIVITVLGTVLSTLGFQGSLSKLPPSLMGIIGLSAAICSFIWSYIINRVARNSLPDSLSEPRQEEQNVSSVPS